MDIFGKPGGYRLLDTYILGNIIQLATLSFCKRFLNRTNDPCGRQYDQMTQAARSGIKNFVEGSERRKTSAADCIRLVDVGRASFSELHEDYITWLLALGQPPWRTDSPEAQAVFNVRLDTPEYDTDITHASCVRILAEKGKFAAWLDSADSTVAANALVVLLSRELNMMDKYLEKLAGDFVREGGIHERMTAARVEEKRKAHEPVQEDAPGCPKCGEKMRLREGRNGKFWSCSAYPTCRGTRNVEEGR